MEPFDGCSALIRLRTPARQSAQQHVPKRRRILSSHDLGEVSRVILKIKGREIMRLRSTREFASLAKRKITIGARQLPQLTASTAVYLARIMHQRGVLSDGSGVKAAIHVAN